MQHAADLVLAFLLQFLTLLAGLLGALEGVIRHALASIGIGGPLQTLILVLLGTLFLLAAFRLFGRFVLALLVVFLLLVLLRALLPAGAPLH